MKPQNTPDTLIGFKTSAHLIKMTLFAAAFLLSLVALPFTFISAALMWPVSYMSDKINEPGEGE